jgi:ferrous iron transport protein B
MSAALPLVSPASEGGPGRAQVLLLGRPNSGKSSLYNAVTGGDAHVGNFPGITVDILEAAVTLPGGGVATVADLPGLYSIEAVVDPATDEGLARACLDRAMASGRPLVVLQVVDATHLALGLRLTRELVSKGLSLVVAVSQRDVLEAEGRALDVDALSREIGSPAILVSAREMGAKEAVLAAIELRLGAGRPAGEVVPFDPDEVARRVIADGPRVSSGAHRRRTFTARADSVLLHPIVGPFLFIGAMAALFAAVFLIADPATALIDSASGALRIRITRALGTGLVSSFLGDGVLGGAGTVLAFMPQIVILTIAMELLEASGYLARGAFLVGRLLRLLGLSGRSFLPLLMGHACAVPAIAATRTIRDPRERLTTILVLPLMTCSARVPTYALVLATFFSARSAWFRAVIFVGLYFAGIVAGLVASFALRRSATKGRSLPLVLEMPAYRVPQARLVARKAWQAGARFLRDVGTSILGVSLVLWALLTVPLPGAPTQAGGSAGAAPHTSSVDGARVSAIHESVAAGIGKALEPVTAPLGFDWRINVGLIGSFGARELMVGTMGVIFGLENAADDPAPLAARIRETHAYTTRTALALYAFFVFACQCMSTVAAIRRETKTLRWPAFVLAYTYVVAYAAACAVYQLGGLIGLA